jgi:hypothetical protein
MPNNSQIEKRWACVKDGKVEQVIIWDGVQEWPPAKDYTMVELADDSPVGPDWDYVGGEFVDNRPQPELEEFGDE